MDAETKKEKAVHFIRTLGEMGAEDLQSLIRGEAGESLSSFFAVYASKVMAEQPNPQATASTLMMLGYLIRANEEVLFARGRDESVIS